MNLSSIGKWSIVAPNPCNSLISILVFLKNHFSELFGTATVDNEELIIFNNPIAPCPMLITNKHPIEIRLSLESFDYWSQLIFQLSHEMCHYVFRQHKTEKDYTLKWFEEIMCEAVSLYSLRYSGKNWRNCSLASMNPQYAESLIKYLDSELTKETTSGFAECNTVEKLKNYENKAEADRDSHRAERNRLFFTIVKKPADLNLVVDYQRYLNDDKVTFNFNSWIKHKDCELLQAIRDIMPVKQKRNVRNGLN